MADKNLTLEILVTAKNLTGRAFQTLTGGLTDLTSTAKKAALAIGAVFAVQKVGDIFGTAINSAIEFEAQMSALQAVLRTNEQQFNELKSAAELAGATTKFTATEAAQGLEILGRAGNSAAESISILPEVLSLATAENLELAESASFVNDALTIFALGAEQAQRVTDLLVGASQAANTNVRQIGLALSYAGGLARDAGLDIETTAAAIDILANNAIRGERAGTGLRQIFSQLADPSSTARKEIAKLGLETGDLVEVLDLLQKAGARGEQAILGFGTEAAPAIRALVREGGSGLINFANQLRNIEGRANEAALAAGDNLRGAATRLASAWDALIRTVSEPLLEPLAEAADLLANEIGKLISSGGLGDLQAIVKGVGESIQFTVTAATELAGIFAVIAKVAIANKLIQAGRAATAYAAGMFSASKASKDAITGMTALDKSAATTSKSIQNTTSGLTQLSTTAQNTGKAITTAAKTSTAEVSKLGGVYATIGQAAQDTEQAAVRSLNSVSAAATRATGSITQTLTQVTAETERLSRVDTGRFLRDTGAAQAATDVGRFTTAVDAASASVTTATQRTNLFTGAVNGMRGALSTSAALIKGSGALGIAALGVAAVESAKSIYNLGVNIYDLVKARQRLSEVEREGADINADIISRTQKLIDSNKQYAESTRLGETAINELTQKELEAYQERLQGAERYFLAVAKNAEAREDVKAADEARASFEEYEKTLIKVTERLAEVKAEGLGAININVVEEFQDKIQKALSELSDVEIGSIDTGRFEQQLDGLRTRLQDFVAEAKDPIQVQFAEQSLAQIDALSERIKNVPKVEVTDDSFSRAVTDVRGIAAALDEATTELEKYGDTSDNRLNAQREQIGHLEKDFERLGLKIGDATSSLTLSDQQSLESLQALVGDYQVGADQIALAFERAFDQVKSPEGIERLRELAQQLPEDFRSVSSSGELSLGVLKGALSQLGVEFETIRGSLAGIPQSLTDELSDAEQKIAASFQVFTEIAGKSGDAITQVFTEAVSKAGSQELVDELTRQFEALGATGQLSGEQIAVGMAAASERTAQLQDDASGVDEAFKALGVESSAAVVRGVERAAKSFDVIKNSARSTATDVRLSFASFAEAAVKDFGKLTAEQRKQVGEIIKAKAESAGLGANFTKAAVDIAVATGNTQQLTAQIEKARNTAAGIKIGDIQAAFDGSLGSVQAVSAELENARKKADETAKSGGGITSSQHEAAAATAETADQAERLAENVSGAGSLTKLMADSFVAAKDRLSELVDGSEKLNVLFTQNLNTALRDFYGPISEFSARPITDELDVIRNKIDELNRKADESRLGRLFERPQGINEYLLAVQQAEAETTAAFFRQQLAAEEFKRSLADVGDSGGLSLEQLERSAADVDRRFRLLGEQDLANLRAAIDDARQKLQGLRDEANSTLDSINQRLEDFKVQDDPIQQARIAAEREIAEIQRQLNEAKAAGDREAIDALNEAIRKRKELLSLELQQVEAQEKAARAEDKQRRRTESGGRTDSGGSGASSGGNVVLDDTRQLEKLTELSKATQDSGRAQQDLLREINFNMREMVAETRRGKTVVVNNPGGGNIPTDRRGLENLARQLQPINERNARRVR